MKKYVYSKGAEAVTVETDGLATINNFMVTGLIGKNYHGLVQAGLNFKMGDEVTIPMMLNAAKTCECKVECYEGNVGNNATVSAESDIGIVMSDIGTFYRNWWLHRK